MVSALNQMSCKCEILGFIVMFVTKLLDNQFCKML